MKTLCLVVIAACVVKVYRDDHRDTQRLMAADRTFQAQQVHSTRRERGAEASPGT